MILNSSVDANCTSYNALQEQPRVQIPQHEEQGNCRVLKADASGALFLPGCAKARWSSGFAQVLRLGVRGPLEKQAVIGVNALASRRRRPLPETT